MKGLSGIEADALFLQDNIPYPVPVVCSSICGGPLVLNQWYTFITCVT